MLPVAVLPAAGILYGIGYWIDPTGWGANSVLAAFLIKAASAIIERIPILFAIGVSVGMAKDHDGTGALAMYHTAKSSGKKNPPYNEILKKNQWNLPTDKST